MSEEILRSELKIELPADKWIFTLSTEYPQMVINILSMSLIRENTCNILVNMRNINISSIISKLESHESIIEFLIISKTTDSVLLNVKIANPWLLISTIENEVIVKYPIRIQNGWAKWEIYASREKIHSLFQNLKSIGINIELISIGKHEQKRILTSRQREILKIAMNEGYYSIPRKISLTELAKKIQVSPSSLSEMLRKINQKLINLV
ncbi:MAG: helix-turn-helix domain-containing protein [Candidatus Helarchaeota archaeon]